MQTLLFIASPGHTGSTLLDLLLGNHDRVVTLGELNFLDRDARDATQLCTCGVPVSDCEFWQRVIKDIREQTGDESRALADLQIEIHKPNTELHRRRLAPRDLARLVCTPRTWGYATRISNDCSAEDATNDDAALVYRAACNITGSDVVVDSSKAPGTAKNRYFRFRERFRLIMQTRDGRAVAASQMRRDGDTMAQAAADWKRRNLNQLYVSATIPRSNRMRVRYEDLCRDPRSTLESVSDFAGLAEPVTDLTLHKGDAHNISGNDHRFRRAEKAISFDERWREQLTAADLEVFDKVAGRLNRFLGYR